MVCSTCGESGHVSEHLSEARSHFSFESFTVGATRQCPPPSLTSTAASNGGAGSRSNMPPHPPLPPLRLSKELADVPARRNDGAACGKATEASPENRLRVSR